MREDGELRIPIGDDVIVVAVDEPQGEECLGDILLVPAFGVAAKGMFPFSYFLTRNGFRVYRVDFRNHVGASSGEIVAASLSLQVEDILAVVKATNCSMVVAVSLSSRVALRALARHPEPLTSVLVIPVVDVRSTLKVVIGTDHFDRFVERAVPYDDILGNRVERGFIQDCIDSSFESWSDAAADLSASRARASLIAGNRDPWVAVEDVERVVGAAREAGVDVTLHLVEAASHKLDRNPAVAAVYFETATKECLRLVGADPDSLQLPDFREIVQAASAKRPRRKGKARSATKS